MNRTLRISIGVLIVLAILIGGFFVFNAYIYNQKQGDGSIEPYRAKLEGEYVCLEGGKEDDCTKGLLLEDGSRYGIDFMLMSQLAPAIAIGDRISAQGVVNPIERISAAFWHELGIAGIFSVTDSVEVLE